MEGLLFGAVIGLVIGVFIGYQFAIRKDIDPDPPSGGLGA